MKVRYFSDLHLEFIKPNKIPLGYTSQCMDTSKEVSLDLDSN